MPTPRPMPILPRTSAVATSDFKPYCSPSNLNVAREASLKASRPPSSNLPHTTIKPNSKAIEANDQPQKQEVAGGTGKRESLKVKNLLAA